MIHIRVERSLDMSRVCPWGGQALSVQGATRPGAAWSPRLRQSIGPSRGFIKVVQWGPSATAFMTQVAPSG